MACIRENAQFRIRQFTLQFHGVDCRHHDILVTIGHQDRMIDGAHRPRRHSPFGDGGDLGMDGLVRHRRVAVVLAQVQALEESIGGFLAFLGRREEQEMLGMLAFGARPRQGALENGADVADAFPPGRARCRRG